MPQRLGHKVKLPLVVLISFLCPLQNHAPMLFHKPHTSGILPHIFGIERCGFEPPQQGKPSHWVSPFLGEYFNH